MWAWTPAFLTAALALQGRELVSATGLGAGLSAIFHVMGLVATSAGGWLSDRWGRTAVILTMLTISGLCSFTFGWVVAAPLLILLLVGIIYAFSAIGDSPVFSTGFGVMSPASRPGPRGTLLMMATLCCALSGQPHGERRGGSQP